MKTDHIDTEAFSRREAEPRGQKAERRQLTVLFCAVEPTSVRGSAPSTEAREAMRMCRDICIEVVQRFEGHLAHHLQDGLQVYFGYPLAHEDNAHRAVSAGLEMLNALQGKALLIRIGIHTGWAVIGGTHSAKHRVQVALSMAPNLAVRLGGSLYPNAVIICATTYQQIRDSYTCEVIEEF